MPRSHGILLVAALVSSCSLWPDPRPDRQLTIASWNVENLFDEVRDGGEYPEFDPERGWSRSQFWGRCQSLATVIRQLAPSGPDVLALQEVEGAHALETLNQRFLSDLGYRYAMIAPPTVAGIKTAVLSRFPFVRTGLLFPGDSASDEPLRPLVEVEIDLGGRPLVLLANHWKSRLPTARGTESLRRLSATVLSQRVQELDARTDHPLIVAVGDFNTSLELSRVWDDASLISGNSVEGHALPAHGLVVFSAQTDARTCLVPGVLWDPWQGGSAPEGSYLYQGQWSRLDHAFIAASGLRLADWKFQEFRAFDFAATPRAWSPRTPDGVSDHFPVVVRFGRSEGGTPVPP